MKTGDKLMCWYFKCPGDPSQGLELWFCELIELGEEYSKCKLYHGGNTPTKDTKVMGTYSDVCTADLTNHKWEFPLSDVIDQLKADKKELLEALEGIIDIGKRDTTNPKYDPYYRTAKEVINKHTIKS